MGASDYWKPGSYNAICYRCGQKYKASQLKREWEGFMVCPRCFEQRNAQDFLRPMKDQQAVPWSQPQPPDSFVDYSSANSHFGQSTLGPGGTVTVLNGTVTGSSRIAILSVDPPGMQGQIASQVFVISPPNPSTGFVLSSTNANDRNMIHWQVIN